MISVNLRDLIFYCSHGILSEEKTLKGTFKVCVEILFEEHTRIHKIDETIDYTKVYDIVKQRMDVHYALLETLAMDIGSDIFLNEPQIKYIRIDIQKVHPPIEGVTGSVGVSWFKNFM